MNANRSTHDPDAEGGPVGDSDSGTAEAAASRPVADLEAEVADLKDRLLRALAEQENIRRRMQRELEDAVKFAASSLARDLLTTADNLQRAIESKRGESAEHLLAGVAATERALQDTLAKHGIRRIDPLGEPFDPNRHQAMFEVADADGPPSTVVEVLQPGYLHHDRLLRPAMVGVSKGRQPAAAAADQD
jgi:molecular chaperone GrpE